MTKSFSQEVLKFLCQSRDAKPFIELVPDELFGDDLVANFMLSMLKDYLKEYRTQPKQANLLELLYSTADKKRLDAKTIKLIEKQVTGAYGALDVELSHLKSRLVAEIQESMASEIITKYADDLKAADTIRKVTYEFGQIFRLTERLQANQFDDPRDHFLFTNLDVDSLLSTTRVYPSYLTQLNRMTNAGGFGSPQLILFAGTSKSFKTGILMNIMLRYVSDLGLKIFYADFENGRNRLKLRALQTLLGATQSELRQKQFEDPERFYDWAVKTVVPLTAASGGDMYFGKYRGMVDTIDRIIEDLDYLRDTFNWEPDIIAHDYLDLMQPTKTHKENRFNIQRAYFEFKNLLEQRGMLGVSLSQLSKAALDVKIIEQHHIAEDMGKIRNADAVFGINQTKKERQLGIARLCPIVQREGVPFMGTVAETCFLSIDYDRQQVKELTADEVEELLNSLPDIYGEEETTSKKFKKKYVDD